MLTKRENRTSPMRAAPGKLCPHAPTHDARTPPKILPRSHRASVVSSAYHSIRTTWHVVYSRDRAPCWRQSGRCCSVVPCVMSGICSQQEAGTIYIYTFEYHKLNPTRSRRRLACSDWSAASWRQMCADLCDDSKYFGLQYGNEVRGGVCAKSLGCQTDHRLRASLCRRIYRCVCMYSVCGYGSRVHLLRVFLFAINLRSIVGWVRSRIVYSGFMLWEKNAGMAKSPVCMYVCMYVEKWR